MNPRLLAWGGLQWNVTEERALIVRINRAQKQKMLRREEMMEGMHEMPYYVTKTTRYPRWNKRRYSVPEYYTGADLTTTVQYH